VWSRFAEQAEGRPKNREGTKDAKEEKEIKDLSAINQPRMVAARDQRLIPEKLPLPFASFAPSRFFNLFSTSGQRSCDI
jgi:hypothetical protein